MTEQLEEDMSVADIVLLANRIGQILGKQYKDELASVIAELDDAEKAGLDDLEILRHAEERVARNFLKGDIDVNVQSPFSLRSKVLDAIGQEMNVVVSIEDKKAR